MRILICIATMAAGGAERQVTYLAKGLVALGHDVHVTLIKHGANYERLLDSHATIHIVNIFPNTLRFIFPLLRLFRNVKPDVIYLWQRPFDVLGGIAAFVSGIPTVHAERTDPAKVKPGLKVWLRNIIISRSRAVIANSDAGVLYWSQRANGAHVVRIPNIIPYEEMMHVQPSLESKGHIVAIGRLDLNKNVSAFLRAVKLLSQKGVVVKAIIVGSGPESDNLKRYVEEQGISNQIWFAGYRNDAWSLLKGSRGFVSLSYYEGEPNIVLEAAVLGCRLIVSDIPAHRSLGGLSSMVFVNPDSEIEVADAIELLQSQKIKYAAVADCISHSSHDWSIRSSASVSRQHLELFSQVLAN